MTHEGRCLEHGRVIDTRYSEKGHRRRRYECTKCGRRFTTREVYMEDYRIISELDKPVWAVVSSRRVEAGDITYPEAAAIAAALEKENVRGVCVTTADSAERFVEERIAADADRFRHKNARAAI